MVHIGVHALIFVEISKLAIMSLNTIKFRLCLIATIPAMVRMSQGAFGGPRKYSLDRLPGRLSHNQTSSSGHNHNAVAGAKRRLVFLIFICNEYLPDTASNHLFFPRNHIHFIYERNYPIVLCDLIGIPPNSSNCSHFEPCPFY